MISGSVFRNARRKLGFTQAEIAKGITTQAAISLLENKNISPGVSVVTKIAHRLGIDLNEAFGDIEKQAQEKHFLNAERLAQQYRYEEVLKELSFIDFSSLKDYDQIDCYNFLRINSKMWVTKDFDNALFEFGLLLGKDEGNNRDIFQCLIINGMAVALIHLDRVLEAGKYIATLYEQITQLESTKDDIFWRLLILDNISKYYSEDKIKNYKLSNHVAELAIHEAQSFSVTYFIDDFYYIIGFNLFNGMHLYAEANDAYLMAHSFACFNNNQVGLSQIEIEMSELQNHLNN